jgi:hypothetical protein
MDLRSARVGQNTNDMVFFIIKSGQVFVLLFYQCIFLLDLDVRLLEAFVYIAQIFSLRFDLSLLKMQPSVGTADLQITH